MFRGELRVGREAEQASVGAPPGPNAALGLAIFALSGLLPR
jgi:hypothetical protein